MVREDGELKGFLHIGETNQLVLVCPECRVVGIRKVVCPLFLSVIVDLRPRKRRKSTTSRGWRPDTYPIVSTMDFGLDPSAPTSVGHVSPVEERRNSTPGGTDHSLLLCGGAKSLPPSLTRRPADGPVRSNDV